MGGQGRVLWSPACHHRQSEGDSLQPLHTHPPTFWLLSQAGSGQGAQEAARAVSEESLCGREPGAGNLAAAPSLLNLSTFHGKMCHFIISFLGEAYISASGKLTERLGWAPRAIFAPCGFI